MGGRGSRRRRMVVLLLMAPVRAGGQIRKRDRETEKNVKERWKAIVQCRAVRRWEDAVRGPKSRVFAMRKMAVSARTVLAGGVELPAPCCCAR